MGYRVKIDGEELPQRGDLCRCSLGHIGIIECDEPQEVEYPDGNKGIAWVGRKIIPPCQFGERWSSRNPTIVYREPERAESTLLRIGP